MDSFVPDAVRTARLEQLVRAGLDAHLLGDLEERLRTNVSTRLAISHYQLMGSVSWAAMEVHRRAHVERVTP